MKDFVAEEARGDFNRARKDAFFSTLFGVFGSEQADLLSLQEVRETLRPRGERYRGMQTVPIDKIVGSEGRYRDFNRQFLPRYEYLRNRWQRVDMAHLTDIILPPVSLYEVGGVYFVRDGNHRVSVARIQGVKAIDAEVVALETEIPMHESMTRDNLRRAVIEHEKRRFYEAMQLETILPGVDLAVSATGRYDELAQHILGHKYYLNECEVVEIHMEHAIRSWHDNVYRPIVEAIASNNLMPRFPDRTPTDLYLWIVRHWDELKYRYGDDVPVVVAATDYSRRYGRGWLRRTLEILGIGRFIRRLPGQKSDASHDPESSHR
jgi:hypothetical protein